MQDPITPPEYFFSRRKALAFLTGSALAPVVGAGPAFAQDLEPNSFEEFTTYNNFYEFGTSKDDPARFASMLQTQPWSIEIDGMVERPGVYTLEDVLRGKTIEERVYRLRCVEAWSMVVPWNGFPLAALLDEVRPTSEAQFVAFETVYRPEEMPGLRVPVMDWPYREGLRLDEAYHPLTLLATGAYGRSLLNQNGAPIRLVVPWKYGFKSIKSLVKITVTDTMPYTSWSDQAPNEYGFYANVNPTVDHPRWSQASERRIGGGLFARRQPTLMFNGYDEVASLYQGMDLERFY